MYKKILARSFSRQEQKKLGWGAFICCLLIALSFCTFIRPFLCHQLPPLNSRLSSGDGRLKMVMVKDTNISISQQIVRTAAIATENGIAAELPAYDIKAAEEVVLKKVEVKCSTTEPVSDFCEINNGDIRINGNRSTVYIASSETANSSWTIKPYARKGNEDAMRNVRKWSVKSEMGIHQIPRCTQNHSVPAILFSLAGYEGNYFHDFSDIIVPLYLASRKFDGEVQFLISHKKDWWIEKFEPIFNRLSKYEIIEIDEEEEDEIHCFQSLILGFRHQNELHIDPSISPFSMKDFRAFLRSSYSLKRDTVTVSRKSGNKRPRLLIMARSKTRTFTNARQIGRTARRLGYDVVVMEADTNVTGFAETVNSCDVLMGVHGAGLTNIVFLPENAVFIQIVPFGGMEWLARTYFEVPAKDMGLRYLEYKIRKEESTLIQQYPVDDVVFTDPRSIQKKGWKSFQTVYLDKQNVKLDVRRFKHTLLKALELLDDQSVAS